MRGTHRRTKPARQVPSTQYIARRAPKRSDSHPPKMRTSPDGRLKIEAMSPAVATDIV